MESGRKTTSDIIFNRGVSFEDYITKQFGLGLFCADAVRNYKHKSCNTKLSVRNAFATDLPATDAKGCKMVGREVYATDTSRFELLWFVENALTSGLRTRT